MIQKSGSRYSMLHPQAQTAVEKAITMGKVWKQTMYAA